jgi:hypothetical protein
MSVQRSWVGCQQGGCFVGFFYRKNVPDRQGIWRRALGGNAAVYRPRLTVDCC